MAVPFNMAVASRLWQTNFRSRSLPIRFFSLASLSFFFLLYTVGLFVYFCSLPVRCFRHFCFVLRVRLRGFLVLCGDNACRTATKRWKKRHKHEQSLRGHCHRLVVLWSLLLPFFFCLGLLVFIFFNVIFFADREARWRGGKLEARDRDQWTAACR